MMRTRPQTHSFIQQQISRRMTDIKQKSEEIMQLTLEASIYKALKYGKMCAYPFSSAIKNLPNKLEVVLSVIREGDDVVLFEWLVKDLELPVRSEKENAFLVAARWERVAIFKWLLENKQDEIQDVSLIVMSYAKDHPVLKQAMIEIFVEHDSYELFSIMVSEEDKEFIQTLAEEKNAVRVLAWVKSHYPATALWDSSSDSEIVKLKF